VAKEKECSELEEGEVARVGVLVLVLVFVLVLVSLPGNDSDGGSKGIAPPTTVGAVKRDSSSSSFRSKLSGASTALLLLVLAFRDEEDMINILPYTNPAKSGSAPQVWECAA
jgi:hypothetical protein